MSHKIRLLLLAISVVGVLAVIALLVFNASKPVPLPPVPNPNGYDDFVKAGQSLAGDSDAYSATNLDQLQAVVSADSESLRLVKLGLTRECLVPMARFQTNASVHLQNLVSCKLLVQLLGASRRLAELEGRTNDAVTICVETIRFGNEISRGCLMIDRLVGMSCEAVGCDPLIRLVPAISPEEMRRAAADLESIVAGEVRWAECYRNDRGSIRREFLRQPNPILLVQTLWSIHRSEKLGEARDDRIRSRLRLLMGELALRSYRQEHGKPPARFDELVPAYLKVVPQDPFSGKPLVYRPQGTNWLLYSVGPDRVDDGGQAVAASPASSAIKGDVFFDSPW